MYSMFAPDGLNIHTSYIVAKYAEEQNQMALHTHDPDQIKLIKKLEKSKKKKQKKQKPRGQGKKTKGKGDR